MKRDFFVFLKSHTAGRTEAEQTHHLVTYDTYEADPTKTCRRYDQTLSLSY